MIDEDHTLLSLKYTKEHIPGYILYWDTAGHIACAFSKCGDEIKHGTPERALMQCILYLGRQKKRNEKST